MRRIFCKFILSAGLVTFQFAALAQTPPAITTQPTNQTVACGGDVTFSVTANGSTPLDYFWSADGQPLGIPATTASLTLSNILFGSGTRFTVVVSNAFGMVASEPAILTVTNSPRPSLSITTNVIVSWPHTCGPFTLRSTTNVSNLASWFPVAAILNVDDNTNWVNVSSAGSGFYELATIPPTITDEPVSQTADIGGNVTFSVAATTDPTNTFLLPYQWRLNGIILPGQTNASLSLTNVQRSQAGSYDVVVANNLHAAVSQIATLKVNGVKFTLADNFADRVTTNSITSAIDGTNLGATNEFFEPKHAGVLGGKSVWLAWQAPTTGIATFDTKGSAFDTVLAVYTGTNVASLTAVTSDDDSGGFYTSQVQFNAVAGTTYQIAIDGIAGSSGNISLNWNLEETSDQIPQINTQPQSQTVLTNTTASFTVKVDSTFLPLTYQWQLNGSDITNNISATTNTLVITNAQLADLGRYTVVVKNTVRGVTSTSAYLDLVTALTGSNVVTPERQFKDKLEIPFDAPPNGNNLLSFGKPRSRLKPQINVAFGSVTYATISSGLGSWWESTVCGYAVSGTLYANVIPASSGTLSIDTCQSFVDTILKVRLPNGYPAWIDNSCGAGAQIVIYGAVGGVNYPVTIGMKSNIPSLVYLTVRLSP